MSNCTHSSTYGYRSRQCPRCKVLLRPTDFSEQGVCTWCQWELDEPVRRIVGRFSAQKASDVVRSTSESR